MRGFFRDESGASTLEYLVGAGVVAAMGGYLLSVLLPSVNYVKDTTSQTIYADYYLTEN